jgi:hypothetical protein
VIQRVWASVLIRMVVVSVGLIVGVAVALAEPNLLRDLPPDVQVKIVELAQIFSAAIQTGKLTDAQIKTTLNSGDVDTLIRSLGPEAAHLLQDITTGLKANYSDEQLHQLLGGLIGVK